MSHLPFSATRVIKASRSLTLAEKLVWIEDYGLDGLEGAWISHENLAERLGMTAGSVHVLRKRLQALELHASVARPGARTRGWHALLPDHCIPSAKPSPTEVRLLAATLDEHIARIKHHLQHGRQLVMAIPIKRQRRLPATGNGQLRPIESSGDQSGVEVGASRCSAPVREHTPAPLARGNSEEGVFDHSNRTGTSHPIKIGDIPDIQRFVAGGSQ